MSREISNYAVLPLNLWNAESAYFLPEFYGDRFFELNGTFEHAFHFKGHQDCGSHVNILQLWQSTQDGLSMLKGFDSTTPIGQFATLFNAINDDGVRGHYRPSGLFKASSFFATARCRFPHDFSLIATLPVYEMSLNSIEWESLTQNNLLADVLVKEFLLDGFFDTVQNLGQGLDLRRNWKRSGVGDLVTRVAWDRHFPQWRKPIIKDVRLDTYVGLSLPTGKKSNINELFSLPFGNEGSLSILFGGGIELVWGRYLRGGLHIDLNKALGATRLWRIKTDRNQTDLLLLGLARARKIFGMTQNYRIHLDLLSGIPGCSLRLAYHHIKHNKDKLALYNSPFSEIIANTATHLQEWTTHDIVISGECAPFRCFKWFPCLEPRCAIFYKHPLKGRQSVSASTVSFSLTLDF